MNEEKLQILISATDKSSSAFKSVTKGLGGIGKGFKTIRDTMNKAGDQMVKVGGILTASLTAPIVAFGISSVKAFQESELASARLASSFKGVGGITKETANELGKYASALQRQTAMDDEAITSGMAMLGTFRLTVDQVRQLTPAMLDAAAALEKTTGQAPDMEQLAIQIGKAASSGNVGMLKKWGLSLTKVQEAAFKTANQQERVNILTQALADNFGGMASATAHTLTGKMRLLSLSIEDFKEKVGEAIMKALTPYVDKLQELADILDNLSPDKVKQLVLGLAGLGGLGPAIIAIGFLTKGLSALLTPIGFLITAIIFLGFAFGSKFVKDSRGFIGAIKRISDVWDRIKGKPGKWSIELGMKVPGTGLLGFIDKLKGAWDRLTESFKSGAIRDEIKNIQGAWKKYVAPYLNPAIKELKKAFDEMGKAFAKAMGKIPEHKSTIQMLVIAFGSVVGMIIKTITFLVRIATVFISIGSTISLVSGKIVNAFSSMYIKVINFFRNISGGLRSIFTGIGKWIAKQLRIIFPHIKLPHFILSWSMAGGIAKKIWEALGFQGMKPSLGVKWYQEGGIFKKPSLIGVGEAGPEAVVPLNRVGAVGGITINVTGNTFIDAEDMADKIDKILMDKLRKRMRVLPYY